MASIIAADLFSVNGMTFVITGGGSGIGAMMANVLDSNGASKVFILGRREASLKAVASKAVVPIVCDVTSKDSLAAAAIEVEKQTPFINAVIANSGVTGPADAFHAPINPAIVDLQKYLWNTPHSEVSSMLDINFTGAYFTFIAFLNLLEAGNTHPDSVGSKGYVRSQFITTSSVAGFSRANMVGYPYGAGKAALIHLTKMLSTEFASYGIRANSIVPGIYPSEVTEGHINEGADIPGNLPKEINPALRSGNIEDIAGAILYLVSRAGGFVNGAMLLTDGGALSIRQASY